MSSTATWPNGFSTIIAMSFLSPVPTSRHFLCLVQVGKDFISDDFLLKFSNSSMVWQLNLIELKLLPVHISLLSTWS